MKRILILMMGLVLTACPKEYDGYDYHYRQTEYEPVVIHRDDLNSTLKLLPPRQTTEAGKIYRQGDFLFINDKFKGIHVIDNSNPSDPRKLAFIEIPGNLNLSMFGDIMYFDHASDLVAMRYDGDKLEVLDRNPAVFPELAPPDVNYIPSEYLKQNRPANTVIINWIKK